MSKNGSLLLKIDYYFECELLFITSESNSPLN